MINIIQGFLLPPQTAASFIPTASLISTLLTVYINFLHFEFINHWMLSFLNIILFLNFKLKAKMKFLKKKTIQNKKTKVL